MILNAFLWLGNALVSIIVNFLPQVDLPILDTILTAIGSTLSFMNNFNFILPVSELYTILSFIISFEVIMFGIKLLFWLYKLVPFFGKDISLKDRI